MIQQLGNEGGQDSDRQVRSIAPEGKGNVVSTKFSLFGGSGTNKAQFLEAGLDGRASLLPQNKNVHLDMQILCRGAETDCLDTEQIRKLKPKRLS